MKTFEVCDLPVRAAKFVARKNWVVTGAVSWLLKTKQNMYNVVSEKSIFVVENSAPVCKK